MISGVKLLLQRDPHLAVHLLRAGNSLIIRTALFIQDLLLLYYFSRPVNNAFQCGEYNKYFTQISEKGANTADECSCLPAIKMWSTSNMSMSNLMTHLTSAFVCSWKLNTVKSKQLRVFIQNLEK